MPHRTGTRKRRLSLAECKQICPMVDQELDHFDIAIHAGNVHRGVAEIPRFADINAGFNQGSSCGNIAPSHNTMKPIVAINAASVHIGEIDIFKVARFPEPGQHAL